MSHWTGGLAFVAASGALPKSEHSGTFELGSLQVLVVVGGGAVLSEQLSKVVGVFAEQIVDAAICSTVAIYVGVGDGSFAGSRCCCCCGGGGGGISGFGAAADRKGERKDSHYVVLWWYERCTGLWCFQK